MTYKCLHDDECTPYNSFCRLHGKHTEERLDRIELTDNFSKVVIEHIKGKFRKDPSSKRIKGFGIKLIE